MSIALNREPATDYQELSSVEVHKENFVLGACIKLRDCLDAIKGDTETFFKNNVSTDEEAYMVFEDLLVENLQAELNEVFNLDELDSDSDCSADSDLESDSEESSDEESDEGTGESDDSAVTSDGDTMDES